MKRECERVKSVDAYIAPPLPDVQLHLMNVRPERVEERIVGVSSRMHPELDRVMFSNVVSVNVRHSILEQLKRGYEERVKL